MPVPIVDPARYPFTTLVQSRHVDLDVQKALSNVAFSELFEEARTLYSLDRRLKSKFDPFRRVLSQVLIEFHADAGYPAALSISVGVESIGSHGWTLSLIAVQQEKLIASCESEFALRGEEGQVELPPALVAALTTDLLEI